MFSLFNKIASISTSELQNKLNQSILLVDVRTANEYRAGHISQAKNVPLNKINTYQPKENTEIYVICQSGMRSKQAAKILKRRGYSVVNVRGGMNQWQGTVKRGK